VSGYLVFALFALLMERIEHTPAARHFREM
jgi:hypothetical protein